MQINYTKILYGESALEHGVKPDDFYTFTYDIKDVCCKDMQEHVDRNDIAILLKKARMVDDGIQLLEMRMTNLMHYCPFCGAKFIFNEVGVKTRVRISSPPKIRYEYEYELKTLTTYSGPGLDNNKGV